MARRTPALSLQWKLFLAGAVVVLAVSALTLALAWHSAERAADAAVARGLGATRAYMFRLLESRERALETSALVFARNHNFRVLFENPHTERAAFLDHARKAAEQTDASTVHIIDARGVRLARSDNPAAPLDTIARSPLFARVSAGRRATGAMTIDSVVHQAVAVPIEGASGRVVGVLVATRVVNDSVAREIAEVTSSAVIFFALDSAGRWQISGSSLERDDALQRLLDERASIWAAADPVSPAERDRAESDTAHATSRVRVTLDESRWVASGAALRSASGTSVGGFVALQSLDEEMAAFTRLQRTLLLAALAGLILALGLSYLITRAISRRVRVLELATRRAAEGDYATPIPRHGGDEIALLAGSLGTMLVDMKERRELADFLSSDEAVRQRADSGGPERESLGEGEVARNGLHPGQKLAGRYEIVAPLGSGVMGAVYRAIDLELSEPVAIKTLRREFVTDSTALARLRSELRVVRRISHRNVVRTHDMGETDGLHFIAMEYVEGTPLKALMAQRGRLPVHATLPIARQLCRALEVVHEAGIIHRDIKPDNVVVASDGTLKVMDFGIGRLLARPHEGPPMETAGGTTEYMAPEQVHGQDVDGRADIYAVAVVIYECLTGRTPYNGEGAATSASPAPPHELVPDIPRKLSDAVLGALHRDRKKRPKTIAGLRDLLVAE